MSVGENHPDYVLTLQNLAELYKTTGRYEEAEPIYRQSLNIWRSVLGDAHPSVALALHNLGALYHGMGKYTEAEPLYRQALRIRSASLREDHSDVATTLYNLAALCAATTRENEALEIMERAQGIHDRLIPTMILPSRENRFQGATPLEEETAWANSSATFPASNGCRARASRACASPPCSTQSP